MPVLKCSVSQEFDLDLLEARFFDHAARYLPSKTLASWQSASQALSFADFDSATALVDRLLALKAKNGERGWVVRLEGWEASRAGEWDLDAIEGVEDDFKKVPACEGYHMADHLVRRASEFHLLLVFRADLPAFLWQGPCRCFISSLTSLSRSPFPGAAHFLSTGHRQTAVSGLGPAIEHALMALCTSRIAALAFERPLIRPTRSSSSRSVCAAEHKVRKKQGGGLPGRGEPAANRRSRPRRVPDGLRRLEAGLRSASASRLAQPKTPRIRQHSKREVAARSRRHPLCCFSRSAVTRARAGSPCSYRARLDHQQRAVFPSAAAASLLRSTPSADGPVVAPPARA